MIAPGLVERLRHVSYADLEAMARATSRLEARRLRRAWLRTRPALWLAVYDRRLVRGWSETGPRLALAVALSATPRAAPGRPPSDTLALMGRGFGKTEIARGLLLHRLLEGDDVAAVYVGATAIAAAAHTRALQQRNIPEYRVREKAADVLAYRRSPLGQLYPDLRWTGDVTRLLLLHEDRQIPIWARGLGSQIRGLNEGGLRPTLAVLDDPQSEGTAGSAVRTRAALAVLDDEIGGLGDLGQPVARWVLANAIAQGDVSEHLEQRGGWRVIHGRAWTPTPPPDSPAKQELMERLRAHDPGAAAFLAAHEAVILQGARPTDAESTTALDLLALEASRGSRAFLRAYQCVRFSAAERLWPMELARYVEIERGELVWPDGHRAPLQSCRASAWLDPRYSDDRERNDFAACALVLRAPSGRRVVASVDLERSATAIEQRALYWRAVDRAIGWGIPPHNFVGGYEGNGGVKLAHAPGFADDARERRAADRAAPIPTDHYSGPRKYGTDRLDRVSGDIETGALAFLSRLRGCLALQQAAQLPHAEHDDGPDAIERADGALVEVDPYADWLALLRASR
jgi:hypothetical protein